MNVLETFLFMHLKRLLTDLRKVDRAINIALPMSSLRLIPSMDFEVYTINRRIVFYALNHYLLPHFIIDIVLTSKSIRNKPHHALPIVYNALGCLINLSIYPLFLYTLIFLRL